MKYSASLSKTNVQLSLMTLTHLRVENDESTFAHSGLIRMAHFPSKTAFLEENIILTSQNHFQSFLLESKVSSKSLEFGVKDHYVR